MTAASPQERKLVMVTGSRGWDDYGAVKEKLAQLPPDSVVMHGGAAGADTHADIAASALGLQVERYEPFSWRPSPQRYHERNDRMLSQADLVLAFWDGSSRGTKSVIEKAKRLGIPFIVIGVGSLPENDTSS